MPEPKMTNRDVKTEPKLGKYWCHSCDARLVSKGGKCPNCGNRDIYQREEKNKESNHEEE